MNLKKKESTILKSLEMTGPDNHEYLCSNFLEFFYVRSIFIRKQEIVISNMGASNFLSFRRPEAQAPPVPQAPPPCHGRPPRATGARK